MKYLQNRGLIKFLSKDSVLLLFLILLRSEMPAQSIYIDPDKLSWANFRGAMNPFSDFMAFTRSNFSTTIGKTLTYNPLNPPKIRVQFLQDSSWVNFVKLSQYSQALQVYLLNHEKIHYLITIIEAKKLKKEIIDKKITNIQQLFNTINNHQQIMANRNVLYDAETNHSGNVEAQNKWATEINKELNDLIKIPLDR
jgi:hypothetical protein